MNDLFHQFEAEQAQANRKELRPHQVRASMGETKAAQLLAQGWKPVAGFDRYLISSAGVIYSTIRSGRFLSPTILNSGYEYVSLMAKGATKPEKHLVHRLVAAAFCEGQGPVVNHKDGNKRNNSAENLEWCTYAENNDHARDSGLVHNFGSKHYAAKLTADQVLEIRRRASVGELHRVIADDFGIGRRAVDKIARGEAWRRVQ